MCSFASWNDLALQRDCNVLNTRLLFVLSHTRDQPKSFDRTGRNGFFKTWFQCDVDDSGWENMMNVHVSTHCEGALNLSLPL